MRALDGDEALGLAVAALGLVVLVVLIPLGIDLSEVDANTRLLIRPDFWPSVLACLMVAAGFGFFAARRFGKRSNGKPGAADGIRISARGALAVAAVATLLAAADEETGLLVPAMIAFLVASFAFGTEHRLAKVMLAIAVPVVLVLFFERVANISMPLGSVVERLVGG